MLLSTLCYFNSIISNNFGTSPFLTVLVIIYLLVYKILIGRIQKYVSTQMSTIIVSRGNNRKIVYTNRNQNVKKCWKVAEEQQWRSKCTLPHPHLPAIPSRQFFNKFRGFEQLLGVYGLKKLIFQSRFKSRLLGWHISFAFFRK